jgi:hypothetical protein
MTLLSKEIDWLPGDTTGSRLKTIRSLPGSVEIVGFTGALKLSASRGGLPASSWKLICMPTSPTNNRRALSRKLTGAPRKRGRNPLSELSGTNPREFSIRKGAMKSKSRPPILARVFPATNSASTALYRSLQCRPCDWLLTRPSGSRSSSRPTYSWPQRSRTGSV